MASARSFISVSSEGGTGSDSSVAEDDANHDEEDSLFVQTHDIDEDVYGLAMTSIIRDTAFMARTHKSFGPRAARVCISVLIVLLTIFMQAWLLHMIKKFVTPEPVMGIRDVYSRYQWHMYGEDPSHFERTVNGKLRGKDHDPSWFDPEAFKTMSDDDRESICHIPLSQPGFTMTIIFIWSLTVAGDIRTCVNHTWSILSVKTLRHMAKAVEEGDDDTRVISGLTLIVKVFLLFLIVIPRLCISCYLLWLGCRWLLATVDFQDLVLNGVALEFILQTKDLLFTTIVSHRSIADVKNTKLSFSVGMPPTYFTFFGALLWLLVAVLWTVLYTYYFQQVLPGYRWDVREVCSTWLLEQFCADPTDPTACD